MKMIELEEFNSEIENRPALFTTGAFISPRKITVDGKEHWFWIVESFEGDSYFEGAVCNPLESSETKQGLFAELERE
ncbi:MAG: hypothetical protein M3371_05635 [Acidobacteriota bacterium]|nr:hypothetical protein [Acidobacteriota bacterium]